MFFPFNGKVNLVLEDAIEFTPDTHDKSKFVKTILNAEILLNGNQIATIIPGGSGPPTESISSTESA